MKKPSALRRYWRLSKRRQRKNKAVPKPESLFAQAERLFYESRRKDQMVSAHQPKAGEGGP